jgi:hypothetical protein
MGAREDGRFLASTVIYDEGKQGVFTQTGLNHKSSKPSPESNILFLNQFKGNRVRMRKQIDGFNIWSKKYPYYLESQPARNASFVVSSRGCSNSRNCYE